MATLDIILTLVFSVVMLFFMIFPAMKITAWIDDKKEIPKKWYNPIMFFITIILSMLIGVFLKFA
ncbi:MAG TPA: hypothetical protein EYG98_02520 [Sulfurovum sp.]|nr:hypothetical protein [Sulfurovum sp.]